MTITGTTAIDLRDMTDAELADLYRSDGTAEALAEAERRDRAERRERAERQLHDDWYDAMHAQRTAFEAEGIGYLLNAEGKRRGISEWALWTGDARLVELYGTDEIRAFFKRWPRLTLAGYKRQRARAGRIQRGEWRDRDEISEGENNGEELDRAQTAALRRGTPAGEAPQDGTGGAVSRGGRSAGAGEHGEDGEDAGADRRAGRPVRGHGGDRDMGAVRTVIRAYERHDRAQARQAAVAVPVGGTVHAPGRPVARRDMPPVPGDQLLDLVRDAWLGYFARYPSPAALDAVTLWAAHTHMRDEDGVLVFRATPRLWLLSSEPGSGKGRVLELLMRIVPNCFGLDLEPTKAGLVHTLNREHATVLLDEGDLLLAAGERHSGVRAVINGGTYRHGTVVNGKGDKATRVPVFGPIAMAGLDVLEKATGDSLKALLSRGVKIRMEKAKGDSRPPRMTRAAEESAVKVRYWLERWAGQVRDEVADADPEVPEDLEGRGDDIWVPLLAVAGAAGGTWPARALAACRELALAQPASEDTAAEFAEFAASLQPE